MLWETTGNPDPDAPPAPQPPDGGEGTGDEGNE